MQIGVLFFVTKISAAAAAKDVEEERNNQSKGKRHNNRVKPDLTHFSVI